MDALQMSLSVTMDLASMTTGNVMAGRIAPIMRTNRTVVGIWTMNTF